MGDEAAAAQTFQRAYTGSMTQLNSAEDAALEGLPEIALNTGARALTGQGWMGNAVMTARDLYRYGAGQQGVQTRNSIAHLLTVPGPDEAIALAQREASRQAQRRQEELARAALQQRLSLPLSSIGAVGGVQGAGQ